MRTRQSIVGTVPEAYPELLHYTSLAGLVGILDSQSIRATHSAFLNDSSEIALFFEHRLEKVLEAGIRAALAADPELQVLPQYTKTPQDAENAISRYAKEMGDAIRTATLHFNKPYIACFSAPANDRVRNDGLLSQWRGYGSDGGYALVFDSKKLEELLKIEFSVYLYQYLQWGDVHYYQSDSDAVDAEPEIHLAEHAIGLAIGKYIKNSTGVDLEAIFDPVTTLSCFYKHWGFHEEREVRIVVVPMTAELVEQCKAEGEIRPIRQQEFVARRGTPVPYHDLFAAEPYGALAKLPIVRVIIGPHPQSHIRQLAVEEILRAKGINGGVVVSNIPYIGA